MMIVYKITNKINGKIYIGQTITTLKQRWKCHKYSKDDCLFHKAIRKYGAENFTVEQIDVATDMEELNKKEKYWIEFYDCMIPKGYNSTTGGDSFLFYEGVRKKMSEKRKGVPTNRHLFGEANPFYGKTHSEETRRKLSEYAKQRTGERNPFYGHKLTQKQKDAHCKRVRCVETGEVFESMAEACAKYNIDPSTMSKVLRKIEGKTCKGFHWEYDNKEAV
jgi:group I intron endonuclease